MIITYSTQYLLLTGPHDRVRIKWDSKAGNGSGTTECEAWQLQHHIDLLESTGHQINGVDRA